MAIRGFDMWGSLIFGVLACLALLYVPGYLLGRAARLQNFKAVVLAPAFSLFAMAALGIVFYQVGFSCSCAVLAGAMLVLCLLVRAVASGVRKIRRPAAGRLAGLAADDAQAWKLAALYVGVSLVLTVVLFLLQIDGPESFARNDDTAVHMSFIRHFLDTGFYSSLHVASYDNSGQFYPAAWHVLAALVSSLAGDNVMVGVNATVIVFLVFVFPLNCALFFREFLAENRPAQLAGSLFVLGFCAFPWGFLVFGQLFANMVSWMLIPGALVLLRDIVEASDARRRVVLGLMFLLALCAIALSQPNGVFVLGIAGVLWGVSRMFYAPGQRYAIVGRSRVLAAVALVAGACAVWGLLFLAPPLQSVTSQQWAAELSVPEALAAGFSFMFSSRGGVQPGLSVLVLLGIVYSVRNRRYLWFAIAFALAMTMYLVDVSTDGVVKQVISGFFYNDYRRTGAMAALFALPLAALGFGWIAQAAANWTSRSWVGPGILVVALCAVQFFPLSLDYGSRTVKTGLVEICSQIQTRYSWDDKYTGEERAFVQKVMDAIDDDAYVANFPFDGSVWAYGTDNLKTFTRRAGNTSAADGETNKLIRTHLADVATNEKVQKAVRARNIRYVLLLDLAGTSDRTLVEFRYDEKNWRGVEGINDETPGFTLLLSEGDMRLYEIDAAKEAGGE